MINNIEISEMFRSVGYEFKIRESLKESKALSDDSSNYEREIASKICERNKEANLREIASRNYKQMKLFKKM